MKKNIWIMNHYAGGMFFSHGGRHYNFAKYLKRQDYDPVVFCCNSKHNSQAERYFDEESLWHEHMAEEIGTPFVFVKARTYVGNGKQRVLNMIDFYHNVKTAAKEYAKIHGKPDVIYASSVHPLTLVAGIQLAKYFGVKCICEMRDLWPESLVAYGVAGAHHPAVLFLRRLEKWIYKKADAIVFTMEGAYDYIVEQGWEKDVPRSKVHYINNGVDLEVFSMNSEKDDYHDVDLDNRELFKVVYTGSIRLANQIDKLIDVAEYLQSNCNDRIKLLLWGAGDQVDVINQDINRRGLKNIILKGSVPKTTVPQILKKSDLNIYLLSDSPLFRFGLSLNKSFEYFASGKPVLANHNSGYSIIDKYECGVCLEEFTAETMAKEIIRFASMPKEEYQRYCDNAKRTAEDYDFRKLTNKLISVIDSLEA